MQYIVCRQPEKAGHTQCNLQHYRDAFSLVFFAPPHALMLYGQKEEREARVERRQPGPHLEAIPFGK